MARRITTINRALKNHPIKNLSFLFSILIRFCSHPSFWIFSTLLCFLSFHRLAFLVFLTTLLGLFSFFFAVAALWLLVSLLALAFGRHLYCLPLLVLDDPHAPTILPVLLTATQFSFCHLLREEPFLLPLYLPPAFLYLLTSCWLARADHLCPLPFNSLLILDLIEL